MARQKLSVWQSGWPRLGEKGEWSGEKGLVREVAGSTERKRTVLVVQYVPEIDIDG